MTSKVSINQIKIHYDREPLAYVCDRDFWLRGVLFIFVISLSLKLFSSNMADPDLWGYMSFGRLFWASKKFPYQDVFSYVPTLNPWIYHEWLTGVLFYQLYENWGGAGLQVFKYAMGLATIGLVYLAARVRGAHSLAAALFVLIILTVMRLGYFPVRAQVFTFFFLALSLYLLERARLNGRWRGLYLLPFIQLAWCNLHGGFLAGLGLMALYAGGELLARRRWLPYGAIFGLSLLATLINPYGVGYWEYMVRAVTMPRPNITEWASIPRAYQYGLVTKACIVYFLVLTFVGLWGMWRSRWREVTASLALAVSLVLGFRHIRHLAIFLIIAGVYLPVCLNLNIAYLQSHPWLKRQWHQRNVKFVVVISLALATLLNFSLFASVRSFSLSLPEQPIPTKDPTAMFYPVNAVNFIKSQGLSGNILSKFEWGEYLIWELYPRCQVGYDGRYETVYPPELEGKYFNFLNALPQWREFLKDYPPQLILLDKRMEIAQIMQREPQWRQVYADSNCVLLARVHQPEE